MMKKIATTLLLASLTAMAQVNTTPDKSAQTESPVADPLTGPKLADRYTTELIELKHLNPHSLHSFTGTYGINMQVVEGTQFIAVGGPLKNLQAFKEALKTLDGNVYQRRTSDVELTLYLIEASRKPYNDETLTPALQSVVKQVRNTFPYQGYRLLDTVILRGHENEGLYEGGMSLATGEAGENSEFNISAIPEVHASASGHSILLKQVDFFLSPSLRIKTTVELEEGHQYVIGKADSRHKDGTERPIFLVISARTI